MPDKLKEFLVALGFDIDENSYNKFKQSVVKTTKNVTELGGEAVATGLAIGAMVERVARHYEELYYVAQRNTSTVAGIKAQQYAYRQVGLSAEEAKNSVESFGAAMRTNPGLRGVLRGFGITTEDAQEASDKLVGALRKRFGEKGYFVAAQFAEQFGLSEKTFRTLWQNYDKLQQKQLDNRAMMKDAGFDAERASKEFMNFSNQVDTLWGRFGVLTDRVSHDFLPAASSTVKVLDDLLTRFTRFNSAQGGIPAMAGTLVTSGLSVLLLKKLLFKFFGSSGGAAAEAAAGPAAAAAGGSALRAILGRALAVGGPLGALLGMTEEAGETGGSEKFYITDPASGKIIPNWRRGQDNSKNPWDGNNRMVPYGNNPLSPVGRWDQSVNPKIDQKTEINLLPGASAWDTALSIVDSQRSVNADFVRYLGRTLGKVSP